MIRACVFWITIVLLGCSQSGELQTYRADEVETERLAGVTYVNGQPYTGRLIWCFESGDTARLEEYREGKADGRHILWHSNGLIKEKRFYRDNRKDGHHEGWYENGHKAFDYNFDNGVYVGTVKEWYPGGQPYMVGNYNKEGQQEGMQQVWTEEGVLHMNYEIKNGRKYGNAGIKHCKSLWSEVVDSI